LLQPFLRPLLRPLPSSCDSEPVNALSSDSCHSEPANALSSDPCHCLDSCHSEPAKAGEEPAVLAATQLQSISTYIDILLRWNSSINLTAIRDPEQIVLRHFGESLFAARHLLNPHPSVSSESSVVDSRSPVSAAS